MDYSAVCKHPLGGMIDMDNGWVTPDYEELTVNAECSAYSGELSEDSDEQEAL
jgi:hypothetical protein